MAMQIFRTSESLQAWRANLSAHVEVAMVPTMGFLHAGHLSLIEEARRRCQHRGPVVVTIFVNPTQFGANEDLTTYPRDEAGDFAKCESAGADVVFCPRDASELYAADASTWVEVTGLDRELCGASRPNHFRGVCTIVTKLWLLVRPRWGVFGEKDFQQLAILRRLHRDLFLGGEIVGMPIVREADGLAMSSRNVRLDPTARTQALAISQYLRAAEQAFVAGERRAEALLQPAQTWLHAGEVDYVRLVDASSLAPLSGLIVAPALLAVAVRYGGVRLIDNCVLAKSGPK